MGQYLSDALHRLASEFGQVPVEGELVVQNLVGLNLDICHSSPRRQITCEKTTSKGLGPTKNTLSQCFPAWSLSMQAQLGRDQGCDHYGVMPYNTDRPKRPDMCTIMKHSAITCSLALSATQRLMNHDARVGQGVPLALDTTVFYFMTSTTTKIPFINITLTSGLPSEIMSLALLHSCATRQTSGAALRQSCTLRRLTCKSS